MKHVITTEVYNAGKQCISQCEKTINSAQKLSEVCAISMNPECAALCGKTVHNADQCIQFCTAFIEQCNAHIFACSDMHCKKRFQKCIDHCNNAIQACKKLVPLCHAQDVKCIDESIACVKILQDCALTCQACIGG